MLRCVTGSRRMAIGWVLMIVLMLVLGMGSALGLLDSDPPSARWWMRG
jgi:hypothetical protein